MLAVHLNCNQIPFKLLHIHSVIDRNIFLHLSTIYTQTVYMSHVFLVHFTNLLLEYLQFCIICKG